MRRAHAEWAVAGATVALLVWAATEALTAIGAQSATIAEQRGELRSTRQEVAAVLRINVQVTDSNKVLERADSVHRADAEAFAHRASALEHQADVVRAERANRQPLGDTTPSDSVVFYREQLEGADAEVGFLRAVLEQRWQELAARDSIDRTQRAQIALLAAAKDSAVAVLTRADHALAGVAKALAQSEPRCRLARLVPCPSRTFAFVAGGAAAVLAYNAVRQVHR